MITPQLLDYIKKSLSNNIPLDQIKTALMSQGWKNEDINQAINQISGNSLEIPRPETVNAGHGNGNIVFKFFIVIFLILILGVIAYFILNKLNGEQKFKNTEEIFKEITSGFNNVKTFKFNGNVEVQAKDYDNNQNYQKNIFSGMTILPEDIYLTNEYTEKDTYTKGIKNGKYEIINTANHQFTTMGGKWEVLGVMDSVQKEMGKIISKNAGLNTPEFTKEDAQTPEEKEYLELQDKGVRWLFFSYAMGLEYIDKSDKIYHYKIIPNQNITQVFEHLTSKFKIPSRIDPVKIDKPIYGEIWIDKDFRIVKEKYKAENQKGDSIELTLNYYGYNSDFKITVPNGIDISNENKAIEDILSGKNPEIAQEEYRQRSIEKDPLIPIKERDNYRLAIVRNILTALELEYDSYKTFPNTLEDFYPGKINQMEPADGNCTKEQNIIKYKKTGPSSFQVSFCLGTANGNYKAGYQTETEKYFLNR